MLLVSPDEQDHLALRQIMRAPAWTLLYARNPVEARQILSTVPLAAVIADSRCWKSLLSDMWALGFSLVVADRLADERLWGEVLNFGAYDLLSKPFEGGEVLHVLSMACRHGRTSLACLSL